MFLALWTSVLGNPSRVSRFPPSHSGIMFMHYVSLFQTLAKRQRERVRDLENLQLNLRAPALQDEMSVSGNSVDVLLTSRCLIAYSSKVKYRVKHYSIEGECGIE